MLYFKQCLLFPTITMIYITGKQTETVVKIFMNFRCTQVWANGQIEAITYL